MVSYFLACCVLSNAIKNSFCPSYSEVTSTFDLLIPSLIFKIIFL